VGAEEGAEEERCEKPAVYAVYSVAIFYHKGEEGAKKRVILTHHTFG
jgi:hypothetical protein